MTEKPFVVISGNIGAGKTTFCNNLESVSGLKVYREEPQKHPWIADFYRDKARYAFQTQMWYLQNRFEFHKEITLNMEDKKSGGIQDRSIYDDKVFARVMAKTPDPNYMKKLDTVVFVGKTLSYLVILFSILTSFYYSWPSLVVVFLIYGWALFYMINLLRRVFYDRCSMCIDESAYDLYTKYLKNFTTGIREPDFFIFLDATPINCLSRVKIRGIGYEKNMELAYLDDLNREYQCWLEDMCENHIVFVVNWDSFPDENAIKDLWMKMCSRSAELKQEKCKGKKILINYQA
jgi:deoxyadenosine/deoxycytidine kinase